jgi:hypothetical protein
LGAFIIIWIIEFGSNPKNILVFEAGDLLIGNNVPQN